MRASEMRAVGRFGGEAVAAGAALIEEFHAGIAGRPFEVLGQAAKPVQVIHDEVSGAAYGAVRGGMRALIRGGSELRARQVLEDPATPPLGERPIASLVLGALNGITGDRLRAWDSELTLSMGLCRLGGAASEDPAAIAAAVSDPHRRVAIFIHGLCETEMAWRLPARGTAPESRLVYGDCLERELDYTSLYLRYNTGLHISENGRRLGELLEGLLAAWPTEIEELVLVGHSMGGLVARGACHLGSGAGQRWTDRVTHVFCLGTPHLGADLEKGTNALSWALARLPETRALSTALNVRSVGIKDLRYGSCLDEDWADFDPDELLRDRCGEVPFLPHATYCFVGAALAPAPVGRMLGDLLVRMPSASGAGNGRGRRIPFEPEYGHELPGLTHFDLLCHPAVLEQLLIWLGPGSDEAKEVKATEAAAHADAAEPGALAGAPT